MRKQIAIRQTHVSAVAQRRATIRLSVAKRTITTVFATTLIAGCGPSPQHQRAEEALRSQQKIDAATSAGVTYLQYRQLLIEAQDAVNQMERSEKPAPGRVQLKLTMATYLDAARLWEGEFSRSGTFSTCNRDQRELIEKYQMPLNEAYAGCATVISVTSSMRNQVWPRAHQQLEEATSAIKADSGPWSVLRRYLPGGK